MSPLDWVKLFAAFAGVAPTLVEQFAIEHPELGDAPKEDEQAWLDAAHAEALAKRFPKG